MYVIDYMADRVITVSERGTLADAQEIINEHNIHQLPVVDSSNRLTGIITDRDIRSAIGFDKTLPERMRVSEIMHFAPVTIDADATLEHAIQAFSRKRFNALPVVRHEKLVGIITLHDVLRAFHRLLGLDRAGARIEVALPNKDDLAFAFDALRPFERDLHSAVLCAMRQDGTEPTLYLRVTSDVERKVEQALRSRGLVLLASEQPPKSQ